MENVVVQSMAGVVFQNNNTVLSSDEDIPPLSNPYDRVSDKLIFYSIHFSVCNLLR